MKVYTSMMLLLSLMVNFLRLLILICSITLFISCDVWNSPYQVEERNKKTIYLEFDTSIKHLDPVRTFLSNEILLLENIYEAPLQYHYLKRPFELIPLTATKVPEMKVVNVSGKELYAYDITIKKNIYYAPHKAFKEKRELIAADYIYQIKRLADPKNHSPIAPVMTNYIYGFKQFRDFLKLNKNSKIGKLDMLGVKQLSRYKYRILLSNKYPQFVYWLATHFFTPMPEEVIIWNKNQASDDEDINRKPIGTGPYILTQNEPNYRRVLERNPNFHDELFPKMSENDDLPEDVSQYEGKKLPFIEKIVFTLEKESIPRWQKFLQGYYDLSGISTDNFDQAISLKSSGQFNLSEEFNDKNIKLRSTVSQSLYYLNFNMLDSVVGGYSIKKQHLRQAISIAINYEEYISIFANGRAIAAQGPIPPGIFGYDDSEQGYNSYIYRWENESPQRKSIKEAKKLMTQAGYPDGIDPKTNQALTVYYDTVGSGTLRSSLQWYQRQFKKIGINLVVRQTDYPRFLDKVKTGQAQIYGSGWSADYPDPENFLFLFLGKNSKVKFGGENSSNYSNETYDKLFQKMLVLPNGSQREQVIKKMLKILTKETPIVWGFHPMSVGLYHEWLYNIIPISVSKNTFKYRDIDANLREKRLKEWNQPVIFPLIVLMLLIMALIVTILTLFKKQNKKRYLYNKSN